MTTVTGRLPFAPAPEGAGNSPGGQSGGRHPIQLAYRGNGTGDPLKPVGIDVESNPCKRIGHRLISTRATELAQHAWKQSVHQRTFAGWATPPPHPRAGVPAPHESVKKRRRAAQFHQCTDEPGGCVEERAFRPASRVRIDEGFSPGALRPGLKPKAFLNASAPA